LDAASEEGFPLERRLSETISLTTLSGTNFAISNCHGSILPRLASGGIAYSSRKHGEDLVSLGLNVSQLRSSRSELFFHLAVFPSLPL
jgi:hypothetical protein